MSARDLKVVPLRPKAMQNRAPVFLFRHGASNRCPWCSGTHWDVGRETAECVGCQMPFGIEREDPPVSRRRARGNFVLFVVPAVMLFWLLVGIAIGLAI